MKYHQADRKSRSPEKGELIARSASLPLSRKGVRYPEKAYATPKRRTLPSKGVRYHQKAYATIKRRTLPSKGVRYHGKGNSKLAALRSRYLCKSFDYLFFDEEGLSSRGLLFPLHSSSCGNMRMFRVVLRFFLLLLGSSRM